MDAATLANWVRDARRRTLEVYADLAEDRLRVPYLRIVNPPDWELGHVAWFQEHWVLRRALGRAPSRPDADALWNSALVAHADRWTLPLPSWSETLALLERVRDQVLDVLVDPLDPALAYFTQLSVFHEDMHGEAFTYTRQTFGWPAPNLSAPDDGSWPLGRQGSGRGDLVRSDDLQPGPWPGDVSVPGGRFLLGADPRRGGFVFDNEKWAHQVDLAPFRIARAPVTQREFAAFVDAGGYGNRSLWSHEGWAWREQARAEQPLYWRRGHDGWERRIFDRWVPIATQPHRPMIHVNAHEAEAWCVWAGRRLPTEAEWERAAVGAPMRGNLDLAVGDTVDVASYPSADSAVGCRQMTGNVWEWTSSPFRAYPGFVADPYAEYSEPWFGDHLVLRGGCFVTRARLLRPTWRNFYTPDRRDVWAGFRTCAVDRPAVP